MSETTLSLLSDKPIVQKRSAAQILTFAGVFLAIVVTGKIGQYIFFELSVSPAVIWPPVGIALAAAFIGGAPMIVPIFLAQLTLTITSPANYSLLTGSASVFFYTLQAFVGAAILHWLNFDGTLKRTKDALIIIGVSLFLPMFAPFFTTLISWYFGSFNGSFWGAWSRATAGGIMSIIILTPFITSWRHFPRELFVGKHLLEVMSALSLLALSVYATFWTTLPQVNVFIILYILFATLFWVGLRLEARIMSLALFMLATLGISGSIIMHPNAVPLSQQLFADELFVILIAPVFIILASLVEERKTIAASLSSRAKDLEQALEKLSKEDQSKNEFIAILAHELRNPLAPIVSTLELLRLEETDKESARLLTNTINQTSVMRRLLDDLLDAARVSQKKFMLNKRIVEFKECAEHAVASVEGFFESKGHQFSVSLPEKTIYLTVDPVRFEQIMVNLLNNAGKYTDSKGKISLTATLEGNDLVVRVTDTGVGIDPDELENIFAPFYQIRAHPRVGSGLGIGLSLTKQLVEMHGGTIEASSKGIGHGSTFSVRLPYSRVEEKPLPNQHTFKDLQPKEATEKWKVLVVDDNIAAAEGIGALLSHRGHSISLAHTGEDGVTEAENFQPDVILLDIGLPDIDGYEVARRIIELGIRAPLIALSGYGQSEHKKKAKDAGFSYHITKPAGLADIENVFQEIERARTKETAPA